MPLGFLRRVIDDQLPGADELHLVARAGILRDFQHAAVLQQEKTAGAGNDGAGDGQRAVGIEAERSIVREGCDRVARA